MDHESDSVKNSQEHAAREKRSVILGIEVREDGHDTPPKGFPASASSYADPVNYMYPLYDEAHIRNALARFSQNLVHYSTKSQKKVYTRMVRAAIRVGIEVRPNKTLVSLLPESLRSKFSKSIDMFIPTAQTGSTITTVGSSDTNTRTSYSNQNVLFDGPKTATANDDEEDDDFFEEELVEKAKHQALPGPQKLASIAKESRDGVILVGGRNRGSTERRVQSVVFDDARFDEDARDSYMEIYFIAPQPEIINGHGVTQVKLHSADLFADDSFDVTDPAIQGLPFYRNMPAEPQLETIAKSGPISFYVPFNKNVAVTPGKDMVIRSVIYPADRTDAHNEYAAATDLEKAAHGWMMHSQELNVEHTPEAADGILPAESYIARAYDSEIDAYPGDWCGVFYAKNEDTKKSISDGVFKGFSIEGGCSKVQEGVRKRMTNILVTKISLVKDPATMIEWVAKGKNTLTQTSERSGIEGKEAMETLKKQLDGLQELTEKLGIAVDSNAPKLFPTFKSAATEAEQKLNLAHDQVTYIAKFIENSLAKVTELLAKVKAQEKEMTDAKMEVTKAQEAVTRAQAELADTNRLVEVLNEIPQVQSFHEKLLAEIAGTSQ